MKVPRTGWERVKQLPPPPKAFQAPDDLGLDGRLVTPVGVWCITLLTARMPPHPQMIPIIRVNHDVAICSLDVKFCHQSPRPMFDNHANDLVKFNVVHGEFNRIDVVVYTRPPE